VVVRGFQSLAPPNDGGHRVPDDGAIRVPD